MKLADVPKTIERVKSFSFIIIRLSSMRRYSLLLAGWCFLVVNDFRIFFAVVSHSNFDCLLVDLVVSSPPTTSFRMPHTNLSGGTFADKSLIFSLFLFLTARCCLPSSHRLLRCCFVCFTFSLSCFSIFIPSYIIIVIITNFPAN